MTEPRTAAGRDAVRMRGLFGGETEERAAQWVALIEAEAASPDSDEQDVIRAEAGQRCFDDDHAGQIRDNEALRAALERHTTDPIPSCDDGSHHTLQLARNVIEARPSEGTCNHCGQIAPCTERRIAVAFVDVAEQARAALSPGCNCDASAGLLHRYPCPLEPEAKDE
jgi:hypothetical protein